MNVYCAFFMFVGMEGEHDFPECATDVGKPPESERRYNINQNKTYKEL